MRREHRTTSGRDAFAPEVLESAILQLPEGLREALLMVTIEGLDFDEVAHILGVSERTLQVRVDEARRSIEAFVRDEPDLSAAGRAFVADIDAAARGLTVAVEPEPEPEPEPSRESWWRQLVALSRVPMPAGAQLAAVACAAVVTVVASLLVDSWETKFDTRSGRASAETHCASVWPVDPDVAWTTTVRWEGFCNETTPVELYPQAFAAY